MGMPTSVTGRIGIMPPLSHAELRDHDNLTREERPDDPGHSRQAWIDVTEVSLPEGDVDVISRAGFAIRGYDDQQSPWTINDDVQEIVDAFPGHAWEGYLELFTGDDGGDTWRLVVKNGRVEEVRPKITWEV